MSVFFIGGLIFVLSGLFWVGWGGREEEFGVRFEGERTYEVWIYLDVGNSC